MKANLTLHSVSPLRSVKGDLEQESIRSRPLGEWFALAPYLRRSQRVLRNRSGIPYNQYSDSGLMRLVRNGDKDAVEYIYLVYKQGLYALARTGISVHDDCKDLIQDVFLKLWERHKTLNNPRVRFYLLTYFRTAVIQYFERKRKMREYSDHLALVGYMPEVESDPYSFSSLLEKATAQLPLRCQEAIQLRLSEQLSNKEIAQRMNITRRAVENYFSTATNRLRVLCFKPT